VLPALLQVARAQAYPSRPITLVVPYSAGGPTDTLARILAEHMRGTLGQWVVIENVTGAGGSLGVGRVARSAADGYTLGIGQVSSNGFNGAVYQLSYDLLKDLVPVALLTTAPMWIIGRAALPADNVKTLVAWLKANPEKASMAAVGWGSASHLCGVYFQNHTGTRVTFVPYRGAAPANQDLVAGQVDLFCPEASNSLPLVKGGKLKAFAVLSKTRWPAAPEVPTMDEAGLPGLYIPFWHGLFMPTGTPRDIIGKLNGAAVAAMNDPTIRQRLIEMGQEVPSRDMQTPEAFAAFQKAEIEKWWPIIRAANIKAD
jgi:tripartite-type tricarboxylate transporter receptor subunit TctC